MKSNSVLYFFIALVLVLTACSKKKYATFCPGEKQTHLKHKLVSDTKKAKILKEITVEITEQNTDEDVVFESSTDNNYPTINKNPIKERLKNHSLKRIAEQKPQKIEPATHKQSIWAFVLFIVGLFPLFSILGTIGIYKAIANLYFLRKRKKEYKMKGFSVAVVIIIAIFFPLFMLVLFNLAFALGAGGLFYLEPIALFFFMFLMLFEIFLIITLVLYAYGDKIF